MVSNDNYDNKNNISTTLHDSPFSRIFMRMNPWNSVHRHLSLVHSFIGICNADAAGKCICNAAFMH